MIRLVSASALRYASFTGGPTVMVMVGGLTTFSTFGRRAERGHTFSVPHRPMGITGALERAANRAAPQRAFSTGS